MSDITPIEIYIDQGDAPIELIAAFLQKMDALYVAMGGDGLHFEFIGTHGGVSKIDVTPIIKDKA